MKSFTSKLSQILFSFKVIFNSAAYLISKPKLYPLIIIPVILNIIVSIILFGAVFGLLLNLINYLIQTFNISYGTGIIYGVGSALAAVLAFIASWFVITSVGIVLQSPFNGKIVESILNENGIEYDIKLNGIKLVWFEIFRGIKFELIKIFIIIIVFIITFVLNFIPVVGTFLYLAINSLNVFFLNLLDLLNPAYERTGISDKTEVRLTIKNLHNYAGVGISAYFLWNIPIVNFLFMPLLFTAATFAFIKVHGASGKESK